MNYDPDSLDGRDAGVIRAILPFVDAFNERYVRLRHDGLENIPRAPAVFVSNHNGGISGPDLACTLGTLWSVLGADAPLYALAHDFAMRQFPALGRSLIKMGALRACPENAHRVLSAGGQVLVYPGGDLEAYRHSRDRDKIIFGPRTGFVRVARHAGVPIVPIVIHGAHRSAYIFSDGDFIARAIRLASWGRVARFPLALALPWGIAVGPWTPYFPLPFPVRMRVLAPIYVEAGDEPAAVRENIRSLMQDTLDELAEET